jgi:hypothetical protein
MEEVELTFARLLAVVWLILWRGVVGAMGIGFVVGFVFGVVWLMVQHSQPPAAITLSMGGLIGLMWYPFVVRMALRKKYKSFRIALVPPEGPVSAFG